MISDGDDWTRNNPKVEFPFMQQVYALYGKKSRVENVHLANEKHDYGPGKRMALYPFISKHLKLKMKSVLDAKGDVDENTIKLLTPEELAAFNTTHPIPAHAITDEAVATALLKAN
jgi:hypothetical protein